MSPIVQVTFRRPQASRSPLHSQVPAAEATLPLPLREGAGGGVSSNVRAVSPLPPTPSRKGRGRLLAAAGTCDCRGAQSGWLA